ncbi:hypothetical protein KEX41_02140 [Burkholderia thailandensis]|uniref:hypothetical protein n=1 Tax=Burkholderia thailandensis TaxID=57975 RepID=UPI00192D8669|nr:hypothetical protein [Burkholderia thailandensis]MBS2127054.1 hypothetical protein [Burkholderia thailandensis]QRA12495.1 hypothetical protein JMY07_08160 [Burkholderia thailandensis]
MKRSLVLFAFACLLAGCDRPQALSVDALADDPLRLRVLHRQCLHGKHDAAFCAQVEQANLRRFFSGRVGPDEYQTLADLPPIPASFDGPSEPTEQRP